MSFGPEMFVDRPGREPVRLSALSRADVMQFPPIPPAGARGEVSEFVTEEFIREAETFQENNPNNPDDYYNHLAYDERGVWWGIHLGGRAIGFAGWRDEEGVSDDPVKQAKTRLVIMDKDYFGQGVGYAAGLGRLWYATQVRGINHLTANVDLNNIGSYKISRALGSACIQDKVMPVDPTRHQMRLWYSTPDRPINFRQLDRPLHRDSWRKASKRLDAALDIAYDRVHIIGDE